MAIFYLVHLENVIKNLETGKHFEEVLENLEEGDVVTHAFHGKPGGNLMEDSKSLDAVKDAIERGVLMDVGHGAASFSFEVMQFALDQGIKADIISTDLHQNNVQGPVFDLPTTLSKLLNLGMSLEEVIKAGSNCPAGFLFPDENENDFLKIGNMADFTVFTLEASDEDVQDSQGVSLKLKNIIDANNEVFNIPYSIETFFNKEKRLSKFDQPAPCRGRALKKIRLALMIRLVLHLR